jgi:alkanesulfonate monooxygenase SsuD/methylene tetrahydromethanopterin reductase-like flavin-dependent oxidoreductase (luciferase family)
MFGPNPFKLGVFGYLHFGGGAFTLVPERWQANWDDIVAVAQIADRAGLEFLLPIARWKGLKGREKQRLKSFETLSHAAVLAGSTQHIGLFATCHVPIVHPVFAAKSLVTIDHASHGRAGVNIVCGWNQDDFDMFGITQLEHDDRYEQGQEWYDILTRMVAEDGEEEFDFNGRFFKIKNVIGRPPSIQQPRPCVLSAAYSPAGRTYAARTSDFLLTSLVDYDQGAGVMRTCKSASRTPVPNTRSKAQSRSATSYAAKPTARRRIITATMQRPWPTTKRSTSMCRTSSRASRRWQRGRSARAGPAATAAIHWSVRRNGSSTR